MPAAATAAPSAAGAISTFSATINLAKVGTSTVATVILWDHMMTYVSHIFFWAI